MSLTLTAITIAMPRLSDSMEEGTIVRWLKAPGDDVVRGDELVEIETDKATMTYEAERDGVLGALLAEAGASVALGAPIAELMVEATEGEAQPVAPSPVRTPRPPRVAASPVARRLAASLGVPLDTLAGTGPHGRVVRADVLAATDADDVPQAPGREDEHVVLTSTQRTIAQRMVASRREIPDFTVTVEIDMTEALALRGQLLALYPDTRPSVNDLLVKAAAVVLREQPALNASWAGDHVVRHRRVNIGVAVAAEDALLVPVIDDADRLTLVELARATRAAGQRARSRSCSPQEMRGATFTISNLGMFGVLSFDAVIDAPQVAILAVGGIVRRPAFDADGAVVARDTLQASLTCDHRAVYGADAARFLQRLRGVIEQPLALLAGLAHTTTDDERAQT
jgi:pyruvate dehydrogenase E2 component (dihydrolipoamide acetyltransferase)